MTTFTTEFTKEDFLALPEYTEKRDAPKDKTPFLLKSPSMLLEQKDNLLTVLEHMSKANAEQLSTSVGTKEVIKVKYYVRHKDGNLQELGGFIRLSTVIQDLLRSAVLKVGEETNGTLVIETGK